MFRKLLRAKLSGIAELSESQLSQLQTHYELMLKWNKVLNLTTVTGLEEAIERHYCESIFLAALLPPAPLRIADIGSGPGFPGFPVAVYRPDLTVTLIESHQRKAVFLRENSRGIANLKVIASRAEDVDQGFDRVISRAVSYDDLLKPLTNLAPAADLLTGLEEPPAWPNWIWSGPLRLPWGTGRFVRTASRRPV